METHKCRGEHKRGSPPHHHHHHHFYHLHHYSNHKCTHTPLAIKTNRLGYWRGRLCVYHSFWRKHHHILLNRLQQQHVFLSVTSNLWNTAAVKPHFFPSQNPVMNVFNISGHSSFFSFLFFYLLSLCLSRPEWQLRSRQEYIKWVYFIGRSLFPSSVESFAFHSRCFDFFSPLMFVFPHEYCKATECTSFATESASIRDYCLWL